jgi:ligand-binding sensor domain-containing protein
MAGIDGSLWIGTAAGLARWQNGQLVSYPETDRYVNAIIEDRNGTVWIALAWGDHPLCQVADIKTICYGQADGIPFPYASARALIDDSWGNLWIAGASLLARWTPSSSTTYSSGGLKSGEIINSIQALAVTPEGAVWVGTGRPGRGAGLQRFVEGKWKPFVTSELDSSALSVSALLVDRENTLWIGTTNEGIYRIRGRDVDHFRGANGLSGDSVNGFYEDREGNLWVATSKGVDIFRDFRVATLSTSEGLSADVVGSVLASRDGAIWIGNQGALDSLRKGKIISIQQNHGLPGSLVTSLFEDRAGQLWVGIDDKLCVYENGRFIPINKPDGKPVGAVTAIIEDVDGNIWAEVVDPNRLVRIHNRKIHDELGETQVPRDLTLASDPGGGIWLGLVSGGLARYRGRHLETFPFKRGPDPVPVREIAVNSDGSVLGATSEGVIGLRPHR